MKNQLLILLITFTCNALGQTGNVTGTITDNNGLALTGANVYFKDLNRGTISDETGTYLFQNIEAGQHKLTITYIGYNSIERMVTVTADETVELSISLEPGVDEGDAVIIIGDRLKGQAKALNQQKNNSNITNVVASDQIGRFPDANIGDAVKRIPGITMQNDQGEARNIIIRGLAPQLNSVMINGERIPSAEGDNRNIQMDLIPSDMIQTIEVNKSITPDMDADAIGGSVNLVTRSAQRGLRVSGTAGSGINMLTNKPIWTGAMVYSNRSANNKLGWVVSASYNNHDFGSDNIEAEWADEAEDADGEDFDHIFIEEMDVRQYYVQRVRQSVSANFDYKLKKNHTVYLQTMYNWRNDWENRYRTTYRNIAPTFDGSGNINGYEGELRRQTKGGGTIYDDRVKNRRLEDQRNYNLTLKGDHLFGIVKINWSITAAQASEFRPHERYIRYEIGDAIPFNYNVSDMYAPMITAVNASDIALNNWEFDELTEENQETKETDLNGRFNVTIPVKLFNQQGEVKTGFRYRGKEKFRDNNFYEYSPLTSDYDDLSVVKTEDYSKDNYLAGDYRVGEFVNPEYLGSLDIENGDLFEKEDAKAEYLAGNYEARENITAGFLMLDQKINNKLSVIAGVRMENTAIEYTGNIVENEEDLVSTRTETQNYNNFLPGLHFKYDVNDNFIVRAAYTNTLARPNYFDLVPYQDIRPDDEELLFGNPDLKPTTSANVDLMVEKYFKSIGLVSAGAFYKDINDFIYTFVNENYVDNDLTGGNEWTLFRPENGGTASLVGAEIAFQRQLDFLPGFWKNFGIYLNYTYTKSDAEGIRNEDGEAREDITLPGTSPNLFNASLSWENKKLVVRVSCNYAGDYLDEVGGSAFSDRYYDRQFFLDVNASYALTDNWRIFLEGNNLTNQPLRYYQGVRDRTMQAEYYNSRFNLGVKFDLFKKKALDK